MPSELWGRVLELADRVANTIIGDGGSLKTELDAQTTADLHTVTACLRQLGSDPLADTIEDALRRLHEAAERDRSLYLMGDDIEAEDYSEARRALETACAALVGRLRALRLLRPESNHAERALAPSAAPRAGALAQTGTQEQRVNQPPEGGAWLLLGRDFRGR